MKLFNNWKVITAGTNIVPKFSLFYLLMAFFIIIGTGCKKDSNNGDNGNNNKPAKTLPILTTASVSSITNSNAHSGGVITSDGNATITSRGVCWGTSQNPTISDNITTDGGGIGTFTSSLTGLSPNVTYYVRAYATNSVGTAYGSLITFATTTTPTLTTTAITQLPHDSVSTGGVITSDGGSAITGRGVCWGISQNPSITDNKTMDGTGIGTYYSALAKLIPNTTYYVRAYATNANGTSYGNQISFVAKSILTFGSPYQGGLIGYILKPGDVLYLQTSTSSVKKIVYDANVIHGIIIDTTVYNPGNVAWGLNGGEVIDGNGTSTNIGSGSTNTYDIISTADRNPSAASEINYYFNNISFNGYNDWFLPSEGELSVCFKNINNPKAFSSADNGTFFTSSEAGSFSFWEVRIDGSFDQNGTKNNPLYSLIACRYF